MGFLIGTLGVLLVFSSLIMILLVLIQRGRGGGLAGAFGGMGGQSALGVRAGDVFTKITVVVAVIWVVVAGGLGIAMRSVAEKEVSDTEMNLKSSEDTPEVKKADGEDDVDAGDAGATAEKEDDADAEKPGDSSAEGAIDGGSEKDAPDSESESTKPEGPEAGADEPDGSAETPTDETPKSDDDAASTDESDGAVESTDGGDASPAGEKDSAGDNPAEPTAGDEKPAE